MSKYDAKADVAALFAVGRDIEPEILGRIFQRINDEARAAALREAEEIARRRGHAYTRATVLTVHNVVEVAARAACIEVADEIAAFIPTPPTSAATTGRETP